MLHDLAPKYMLTLETIALQTRHIIDKLNDARQSIRTLYLSGSQMQNVVLMCQLANVCNMPVVLPCSHAASVVLGAAMLGHFVTMPDLPDPVMVIMQEMTPPGNTDMPGPLTPAELQEILSFTTELPQSRRTHTQRFAHNSARRPR